jgi:hypothetical protein
MFLGYHFRSQVICVFSVVNNGDLSISAAKWRLRLEVMFLIDSVTMI